MIKYSLICKEGHDFEGWFADSAAYDKLAKRKLLQCEHCGTPDVEKQIMAPNVGVKANKKSSAPINSVATGPVDPKMQAMLKMMREVREHVVKNSENVGEKFADEARKIHYGEKEERGIYGQATREQTKELIEEGIEVHPLPVLPEDNN